MTSPNAILMIVKGVAKTPQDSTSAEQGLDSIDLLDPAGFSCDDYAIQLPNLKNGAVWADSPITDGRTLVSGATGNVTETIRLNLTAGTLVQMAAMLSKLSRFQHDCNDFWDTFGQIEPVYLKHQVEGEPGPRYALLYNIEINLEQPIDPGDPNRTVTLSIEREYGWRGIAPGANPKQWTSYINNTLLTASNATLQGGTNDLVSASAVNRQEFNGVNTFQNTNFVDIPANKLPGNLPPLVTLIVRPTELTTSAVLTNLFIGKSTKPTTLPDRNGTGNLPRYNSFAGAAATLQTDAAFVADAIMGIAHPPVSATRRYVSVSFATATNQLRMYWSSTSTFSHVNVNLLRGRYALFLRGEQNAGAFGNITLSVRLTDSGGTFYTSPTISPKITVANRVQLNYLGVVTLPNNDTSMGGMNGNGLTVATRGIGAGKIINYLSVDLYAARSTGVATLRVYDLILIPIDEGAVYLQPIAFNSIAAPGIGCMVYDNTGYFVHGKTNDYTNARLMDGSGGGDNEVFTEASGAFMLSPGVNNRLYLLADTYDNTVIGSETNMTFTVYANIVPRWSGLRDV